MVAVLKPGATKQQIDNLISWFKSRGLDVHISEGSTHTIIGLVGDTSIIDIELLEAIEIIESVERISDPFKSANRKFHPDDTVISIGDVKLGGGNFQFIAGPCSVESPQQVLGIAKRSGHPGQPC